MAAYESDGGTVFCAAANNNAITVTLPSTRPVGSVLLFVGFSRLITDTVATAPSGYTLLGTFTSATASGGRIWIYAKEVVGGETAPTFASASAVTGTSGDLWGACLYCFSGVDLSGGISAILDGTPQVTDASGTTTCTFAAITNNRTGNLLFRTLVRFRDAADTFTPTASPLHTEREDAGTTTRLGGQHFLQSLVTSGTGSQASVTVAPSNTTAARYLSVSALLKTTVTAAAAIEKFRGRDGDTLALNSVSFTYAANTDWSQDVDETFRCRWQVQETAGAIPAYTLTGQLECRLNAGAYQNVTASSTIVKAVASSQFNDGDATTDILTGGLGTFVAGTGSETGNAADINLSSQHTEVEYALQIVGADVANNDVIDIRPVGLAPAAFALASLTVVKAAAHVRPVDDAIGGTDAVAKAVASPQADAATVTDAIDPQLTVPGEEYEQPVDDSIAGTDAQAKATTHPLTDVAAGTDATARAWIAIRSQPDAVAGTDAQAKASTHPLADTAAATDARAASVGHALADPIAGTDAATRRVGSARADTIAGTDTRASASAKAFADTVAGTDARARVWAAKLTVADGLTVTDSVSTSAAGGHQRAVDDFIAGTDALARTTTTIRTIADSAVGTDAKAASAKHPITDAIAGTDARSRVWAAKLTVADGIAATDAVGTSSAGANERAVDDSFAATDAISISVGVKRTLGDSFAATDTRTTQSDYVRQPADVLSAADVVARAWAIIEAQADGLTVTDAVNARIPPSRWLPGTDDRWPPDTDGDWPADTDEDWEAQTDDRWLVSAESRW